MENKTPPTEQQNWDNELSQMTSSEIKAFKNFQNVHVVEYPPPHKEKIYLGWKFWTAVITSVAAVVLAAFRTADAFLDC